MRRGMHLRCQRDGTCAKRDGRHARHCARSPKRRDGTCAKRDGRQARHCARSPKRQILNASMVWMLGSLGSLRESKGKRVECKPQLGKAERGTEDTAQSKHREATPGRVGMHGLTNVIVP